MTTPNNTWWARIFEVANLFASGSGATPMIPAHSRVNVNGDTPIITANPNRRYLLIVNNSDTTVFIRLADAPATVDRGIPIAPNASSYEISIPNGNLYRGVIRANHGGVGNKLVLLTEGT